MLGGLFGITRKFVNNNVGIPIKLDTFRSIEKLNLNYIPLEQTAKNMVDQMDSKKAK